MKIIATKIVEIFNGSHLAEFFASNNVTSLKDTMSDTYFFRENAVVNAKALIYHRLTHWKTTDDQ